MYELEKELAKIKTDATNRAIELIMHEFDFVNDLRGAGESYADAVNRFNEGAWSIINIFTTADAEILIPLKDQLERRIK